MPPWCLAGCPIDPFLPPWCLPGCPNGSMDPFLLSWCLASCPMSPLLPPWCLLGYGPFLPPWCLPVKGNPVLRAAFQRLICATGSQPWSPPQDLPRTGPVAIEIVVKVIQNPAPFQNRDSIGDPAQRTSLVPPRRCKWLFPASLVPPCQSAIAVLSNWHSFLPVPGAYAGTVQMVLSYLPGASLAVRWILSCLPGASTVEPTPGLATKRADRH